MSTVTLNPTDYTGYINSASSSTNFNATNLTLGERNEQSNQKKRPLLQYDLSSIPAGSTINSATLRLYMITDFSDNARTARVYRVKRDWVGTEVTWNEYSSGNSWQTAGGLGPNDVDTPEIGTRDFTNSESVPAYKEFTLTASAIEDMIDGGSFTNNGFLIAMDEEVNDAYLGSTGDASPNSHELVIDFTPLTFQSVKANIFVADNTQDNSSKASIVTTNTDNNSAKASIAGTATNYVKANIQLTYRDKKYYYRIYDGQTFVNAWSNEVLTLPTFRTVINGGASDITIRLARTFDDFGEGVDVKLNNRVEVWVSDREAPSGTLIYSGYITGYRPVLEGSKEFVEVTIFSWIGELQRTMLRDGSGNTTITYSSQDPSTILQDIIDKYRVDGGFINYDGTSIDLTGTSVSYTFNTNTVGEALKKVVELCPEGWYWRVTPQGIIHLHAKSTVEDHSFTLRKNISKMSTFRRIEDMVNRVYFTGGGEPPLYRLYENSGSIGTYGLYSKKIVDQRVTVVDTAEKISTRLINTKKDPEIRTRITIVDSNGQQSVQGYDIETVLVGQTMIIKGLTEDTKTVSLWDQMEWDVDVWDQTLASSANAVIQILSISYTSNTIDIEASSRLPEVPKRIEDINRNLEDTQTVNNPIAPS